MKATDRLKVITKLAAQLSYYSFEEINVYLKECNLPWTNSGWGNTTQHAYALDMLQQGSNEDLLTLYEYFFPDDSPAKLPPAPEGSWPKDSFRLFISHATPNKIFATEIKNLLADFGVSSFVAHEDILPSTEWLDEIRIAINSCHAFAAILCEKFKASLFCDQEVGQAINRGILIIPIRLEIDPYGFIAPIQGIKAFDKDINRVANDMRNIIKNDSSTKLHAIHAENKKFIQLAYQFVNSQSWEQSKRLFTKIEAYENPSEEGVKIISEMWQKNKEITEAFGIPKRIENFLLKFLF